MKQATKTTATAHTDLSQAQYAEYEILWTTKITQKAKIWNDGTLRVHYFNRRALLYDDSHTLVASQFLSPRAVDMIYPGSEIRFDKHLVTVEAALRVVSRDLSNFYTNPSIYPENNHQNNHNNNHSNKMGLLSVTPVETVVNSVVDRSKPLTAAEMMSRNIRLSSISSTTLSTSGPTLGLKRRRYDQSVPLGDGELGMNKHKIMVSTTMNIQSRHNRDLEKESKPRTMAPGGLISKVQPVILLNESPMTTTRKVPKPIPTVQLQQIDEISLSTKSMATVAAVLPSAIDSRSSITTRTVASRGLLSSNKTRMSAFTDSLLLQKQVTPGFVSKPPFVINLEEKTIARRISDVQPLINQVVANEPLTDTAISSSRWLSPPPNPELPEKRAPIITEKVVVPDSIIQESRPLPTTDQSLVDDNDDHFNYSEFLVTQPPIEENNGPDISETYEDGIYITSPEASFELETTEPIVEEEDDEDNTPLIPIDLNTFKPRTIAREASEGPWTEESIDLFFDWYPCQNI